MDELIFDEGKFKSRNSKFNAKILNNFGVPKVYPLFRNSNLFSNILRQVNIELVQLQLNHKNNTKKNHISGSGIVFL